MCVVTTGATVGSILATTISTALGIVNSTVEQKSEKAQLKYQEQANIENAKIAENKAKEERQKGLEEARLKKIETLKEIGKNKSAYAASGLDVNYGTNLDLIDDTYMSGELDALMIEKNADERAKGYESSMNKYLNNASQLTYKYSKSSSSLLGSNKQNSILKNGLTSVFKQIGTI